MGHRRELDNDSNYRTTDWQPLADTDPTPGDPGAIADLGTWCSTLADTLENTASQLDGTCVDQFWNSGAGRQFKDLVSSVAIRCRQAAYRFRTASDVYGRSEGAGYALALDGFQSTTLKALIRAQQARDDIISLARTNQLTVPPEKIVSDYLADQFTTDTVTAASVLPGIPPLGAELHQARLDVNRAVADRDAAAAQAASKLTYLANSDGMSDDGAGLAPGETIQTRMDAYADAQQLAWALAHPDDPQSKAIIAKVANDLNLRSGEPGFVTDVINQSGASLGGIASLLRGRPQPPMQLDHTMPLDASSQATLAAFSQALAATVRSGSLSPAAFAALTQSNDPWSVAMLLQYGPNGAAYGDGQGKYLLAALARNTTDQLIHSKNANDLIFPPGQDAFAAILNRLSENTGASQLALGDGSPEANLFAKNLATIGLASPAQHHNLDLAAEQGAVAKVLISCGIPPNRSDPTAMQGAYNVMTTFIDYQKDNGGDAGPAVQKALASYTVNYMSDLSVDTTTSDRGVSTATPPLIKLGRDDVTSLLKLAYPDVDSIRSYNVSVADQVVSALADRGRHPDAQPVPSYQQLSSLYGLVNSVEGDMRVDGATADDTQAADRLLLVNVLAGAYGNASLEGTTHEIGQPVSGFLGPILPSWFDTGHVDKVQAELHSENITKERTMQIMVLQAYVDAHKDKPDDLASLGSVLNDQHRVQGNLNFDQVWGANENKLMLGNESLAQVNTDMLAQFGWQKS